VTALNPSREQSYSTFGCTSIGGSKRVHLD